MKFCPTLPIRNLPIFSNPSKDPTRSILWGVPLHNIIRIVLLVSSIIPFPVIIYPHKSWCWYAVHKNSCCNFSLCLLLLGAPLCLSPLYNVLGSVPKIFPLFVNALPCGSLRMLSLAVSTLLDHVPHSLAWKPGDEHTQLAFWAHMVDIPQVVVIHLGICW